MGLNPETPEEKELCKDMRNKNLLTGRPMGSAQSGQIPGNANAAANNTSPNTPQPEPPKSKTFSEDKYQEHNTKKDLFAFTTNTFIFSPFIAPVINKVYPPSTFAIPSPSIPLSTISTKYSSFF